MLQNENGPCPLIACANALILSARITLPPQSIRNNVASIDDVVNMLASHALKQYSERGVVSTNDTDLNHTAEGNKTVNEGDYDYDSTAATRAHHIDELLKLFPSLQHGMDVNPKFTLGPTGCEYTTGLGAFDIMGVDLVHGWLVDVNQEPEVADVIGSKTYNELVEMVIRGNESMEAADELTKKITALYVESSVDEGMEMDNGGVDTETVKEGHEEKIGTDSGKGEGKKNCVDGDNLSEQEGFNQSQVNKEKELNILNEQLLTHSQIAAQGTIVKQFLDDTSHQLTYAGLTELHSHVREGNLCVFFRNNHFATLTKHEGILYLLVTDLGYAGVNVVMWEKLDSISGDTDLYDESFCKSRVQNMQPTATANPETLLVQREQSDADYLLALELSRNDNENTNRVAQQEGDLIAAVTEMSLREYNSQENATMAHLSGGGGENQTSAQDLNNNENASETLAYEMQMKINEERDRELALRMQAEINVAETRNTRISTSPQRRPAKKKVDSSCLIC